LQILAIAKLSLWFAPCPERETISFNSCNYLRDRTLGACATEGGSAAIPTHAFLAETGFHVQFFRPRSLQQDCLQRDPILT
jgi:hypothetical protein